MTETDGTSDNAEAATAPVQSGVDVLRRNLPTLPASPGVYRMIDAKGAVLYVGKARVLRKRVTSYTKPAKLTTRIQRMIRLIAAIEVTTTHTEAEALLLEANLIKRLQPPFNILLKDDKSFPYILVPQDHPFPRITKHRGARDIPGEYFGPFASTQAVHVTLNALSRAFPLRSCSDSEFAARTRPCLQYQIKRCTAPCVGRIAEPGYGAIVAEARDFLSGRNRNVTDSWRERMQAAAAAQDYEVAAELRDRIRALAHITQKQDVNLRDIDDVDVIAVHAEGGMVCVQIFFFRAGQNFGNRAYFPAHARDVGIDEVLSAFIAQFYDARQAPRLIFANAMPDQADLLEEALGTRAGHKVEIHCPQRGIKHDLVQHAATNARDALHRRLAETASQQELLAGVADLFGLEAPPQRIEVYDNSHIMGRHAVGAMIVAGPEGLRKSAYRKFNIRGADVEPGDDYGMMREVLTRRFQRLLKDDAAGDATDWPDLLLIDGGKGQLGAVMAVLAELGVADMPVVGIAKGPDRNAGREQFFLPGREPFMLEPRHPVLFYLQRLRDEAHRFAIGTHRAKRAKDQVRSPLDEIAGVGAARKKALLLQFGSAKAVSRAGLSDLEAVPGVSKAVAKKVYDHFHGG